MQTLIPRSKKLVLSYLTILQVYKTPRRHQDPKHFITYWLSTHMKSSRKVFGKDARHSGYIHLCKDMNNKIERLN